ncbi:MAG: ATP F0F1 synthase subunit B [Hyphomicrobiales bacterium]|nr:ATP F0F1 synthase subunit B [Hyphomicrobiales bacterium]
MEFGAEFFVAIAFLLFLAGMFYYKVHATIAGALDARVKAITDELEQAKSLRREAASLLASFEQKKVEAEAEAASIIAAAKVDAEVFSRDAERKLNEFISRRTAQADAKIALAETQATQEVRASAADAAVKAAAVVLQQHASGPAGAGMIEKNIGDLKTLFN